MSHRFLQIDVFADGRFATEPSLGNPLAVVVDGQVVDGEVVDGEVVDGEVVDDATMSRFSSWTNLSEVTFLLPPTRPEADYRVRIWNLARELPFAGHPTLGSCHAWLESGGVPKRPDRIVQECPAGLVEIRRSSDDGSPASGRLAFAAPPLLRTGPLDETFQRDLLEALRIDPASVVAAAWVVNGPEWLAVLLDSADAVLAVDPDPARFQSLETENDLLDVGLVGFHPVGGGRPEGAAYEVRALFRDDGGALREDPVTGSLNASIAQWLLGDSSPVAGRLTTPYVATQGTTLGRQGRVHVDRDGDSIWIGGATKTVVAGTIDLDR